MPSFYPTGLPPFWTGLPFGSAREEGFSVEKRSMLNEKIRSRFASGSKEEKKKKRRELRAIFSNGVLFKNPMLVGALGFIPCLPPAIPCGLPWSFPLFWRLCPYRGADSLLYRKSGSLMGAARFSCGSSGGAVYPCFRADGMAIPGGDSVFGHGGRHDGSQLHGAFPLRSVCPGSYSFRCFGGYGWLLPGGNAGHVPGGFYPGMADLRGSEAWRISSAYSGEGIAHPFFGFLILGFLAALVQYINRRRAERRSGRKVTRL